jgi:hypothetical protein
MWEMHNTTELDLYKLVARLIEKGNAEQLTAARIADEIIADLDPYAKTHTILRAAAFAQFHQIAAEILHSRSRSKDAGIETVSDPGLFSSLIFDGSFAIPSGADV